MIRSDEGLTLETSASESLYGGKFTLSTLLIKPNYTVDTDLLSHLVLNFKAGCVKDHIDNWRSVTTDPIILDSIKHHHIKFEGGYWPAQATKPRQITFSSGEKEIISAEKPNS